MGNFAESLCENFSIETGVAANSGKAWWKESAKERNIVIEIVVLLEASEVHLDLMDSLVIFLFAKN